MKKDITIGWIGTGVMGTSMLGHLKNAGYSCTTFTRTKSKAESLLAQGVNWADSPAEVAAVSDVIFTIVGFPKDVREVYFGENGIFAKAKPGAVLVDMTTTEPSLAVEIYEAAKVKNIQSVDAPVSGGDVGAKKGTLSIMAGGDKDAFDKVFPLFEIMGKQIVYQGEAGSGQHTKMCNQITIAGTMIGVCEALLYGQKAGLDLPTMLSSISGGAAGCWTLDNLAPRIVNRNFDPGFFVEHFIKDMGIALKEAEVMGLSLPGLALVKQLYLAVQAQGHGKLGTHALTLALEKLSGL
ncbi:NAD(P)-dependent oxidoreductase [Draconibacterium sp. IB214405]|uniref:NAD(P)-dependent oxidoreductase n=1 Tax=Draconibacterium sp. IB214405 TaxID=3097352 RepID=UPI002A1466E0|nr:NAD(P)-dependent oxidoreductase [Draconibacterium sp. IB214405]MDX8339341.1 NAD(P)-dependent oxidoreductase [Draconibacterium sp. IB214405]